MGPMLVVLVDPGLEVFEPLGGALVAARIGHLSDDGDCREDGAPGSE